MFQENNVFLFVLSWLSSRVPKSPVSDHAKVLGKGSLPPANIPSIILFDGRGHGNSSGWEGKGPEQFHWKYLGLDMLQVAAAYRPCLSQPLEPNYIFGGCSMGAAAAVPSPYIKRIQYTPLKEMARYEIVWLHTHTHIYIILYNYIYN